MAWSRSSAHRGLWCPQGVGRGIPKHTQARGLKEGGLPCSAFRLYAAQLLPRGADCGRLSREGCRGRVLSSRRGAGFVGRPCAPGGRPQAAPPNRRGGLRRDCRPERPAHARALRRDALRYQARRLPGPGRYDGRRRRLERLHDLPGPEPGPAARSRGSGVALPPSSYW
jgi:hypothetical protein